MRHHAPDSLARRQLLFAFDWCVITRIARLGEITGREDDVYQTQQSRDDARRGMVHLQRRRTRYKIAFTKSDCERTKHRSKSDAEVGCSRQPAERTCAILWRR